MKCTRGYCLRPLRRRLRAAEGAAAAAPPHRRYVTALNNLGDAYEKGQKPEEALSTYQEALNYAPGNKVAASRVDALRQRL